MVTIYTRAGCSACRATKQYLNRHDIGYTEVRVDRDPEARAHVESLGYKTLPVVVAGGMSFCGMRPDRLLALKDLHG